MEIMGRCDFCGRLNRLQYMEETENGKLSCSYCYAFISWGSKENESEKEKEKNAFRNKRDK